MRQNYPRPGLGLAIVLAGLTLAVAVVSGLFLIYQSGTAPAPLDFAPASSIAELHHPKAPQTDHSRARRSRVARLPRVHHRVHA